MIRLFLSLYFAICLGLVVINLSSNLLFEHFQSDSDVNNQLDIERIAQIAQGFKNFTNSELERVSSVLPFQVTLLPRAHLSLLPEQQQILDQDKALTLFESNNQISIYTLRKMTDSGDKTESHRGKLNESLIHISGVTLSSHTEQESALSQSIILLSYLSLGLFVLAWSRPLWRDLTALKQASEQIQKGNFNVTTKVRRHSVIYPVVESFDVMASKISELINNQKQMTHAVSHDIRTPLARIKFSLAILKQQPELLNQTSETLLDDVAEIDHLTSELLTFAQLENEQNLRVENVNMNQLLANLADKLRRNSSIQLDIQCDQDCWFQCDGHLIERSLQNLITNGFKYAKSQVLVTIVSAETKQANSSNSPKALSIEVHDDGEGIAVEHRQEVLRAFSRVDDSRNKNSGGFGLGLAIVSKIVTWHGGSVDVGESHLGGALFRIKL